MGAHICRRPLPCPIEAPTKSGRAARRLTVLPPMVRHEQLLQTVWMKLTNDSSYCQPTGDHWKDIGFQGLDPLTDLRGAAPPQHGL